MSKADVYTKSITNDNFMKLGLTEEKSGTKRELRNAKGDDNLRNEIKAQKSFREPSLMNHRPDAFPPSVFLCAAS